MSGIYYLRAVGGGKNPSRLRLSVIDEEGPRALADRLNGVWILAPKGDLWAPAAFEGARDVTPEEAAMILFQCKGPA